MKITSNHWKMKQGDIWMASLDPAKGCEQAGYRPVLIISGDLLNTHAPVIICCPLTTSIKSYKGNLVLSPTKTNGLKTDSEIMVYHIRSLSKARLIEKIGESGPDVVNFIHKSLNLLLTAQ